jgi:hypothetical protein
VGGLELAGAQGAAARPQRGELVRRHRAEELADDDQLDVLGPLDERQRLEQLELVVEVVLEPQHDRLAPERAGEPLVPRAAARRDAARPQHVPPRQELAVEPRALHQRRGAVAVGDVQQRG